MSASSGITVTDDVVNSYKDLQQGHKCPYIIFKISDDNREVVVDTVGEAGASFEDLLTAIPDDMCRYAVYDCKFETNDGGTREKVCLVVWNPESAKIKQKMVYAATKDALKKKLVGIAMEHQCDCKADLNLDDIKSTLKSKTK